MSPKYLLPLLLIFTTQAFAADLISKKNYKDVKKFMHELVSAHPATVHSVIVGKSDSGDEIEGVVIGDGPIHNLVVATHHGNEYGSTETGMAFATSLAEKPIAGQTVYVIPVLNIDGYNHRDREESAHGASHDPNRDYPGPCGTDGPHALKSTAALASFIDRENITVAATLHTYYPAVVYPWGISTRDTSTPYDDAFITMVKNATEVSHYQIGNSTRVIYPADGTFEDYAYWKHGIWSILFELGYSHNPSQNDIDEMARVNVPGLRKMLELAPKERAVDHAFKGHCDTKRFAMLDRRDE